MSRDDAIKILARSLRPKQREVLVKILKSQGLKHCLHMSRRFGKTRILIVMALITAIHKPHSNIKYATDTQKAARKIVKPQITELFRLIPAKYHGVWNTQDGCYKFKNGSEIHLAGCSAGHEESLRGQESHLSLIDEAGFVSGLDYLVSSILLPQHITTNGKLILASSSPTTPAHEFVEFINEAKQNETYYSYDIYQSGYTKETIYQFCKESGGSTSSAWRREYLNEIITDEEMVIIPEWKKEYVGIPKQTEFIRYFHRYMSMDIGVRDKTALISAYYDFTNARLVITGEKTISGQDTTTKNIAALVKELENGQKFYRRIADNNNLILLQDLSSDYDIHFTPTTKESLSAMVNQVRVMVGEGRVIVSPECKELIACLEFGVFQDNKRKEFGRSKSLGHYDLLASLIYLVRNLDLHTNPIPHSHNTSIFTHYTPPQDNTSHESFKKIFNL